MRRRIVSSFKFLLLVTALAVMTVIGSAAVVSAQDQIVEPAPEPTVLPEPSRLSLRLLVNPLGSVEPVTFDIAGESVTLADRESVVRDGLAPGPYTITLTDAPAGFELRFMRCRPLDGRDTPDVSDLEAGTLTVTLDPGEPAFCDVSFWAPRSFARVNVVSEPPGLVGDSSLEVSGYPLPRTIPAGTARTVVLPVLPAGELSTLTLTDLPDGFTLDTIECLQTSGAPGTIVTDAASATASLGLAEGDRVACTYTVVPEPSRLSLRLLVNPLGSVEPVTFDIAGESVTLADRESVVRDGLAPGPYTITLTDAPAGFELRFMRCRPLDGRDTPDVSDLEAGTLTVTLDPGEPAFCDVSFWAPRSFARVNVVSEPPGLVGDSSLEVSGYPLPRTIPAGTARTVVLPVLPAGELSTLTLTDLPDGFTLDTIECLQTSGAPGTIVTDAASATASLGLAEGDRVACTYTVVPEPLIATVTATIVTDRADVETG
ncbi:MAG: hypothetical protein ACC726_11375, partial [Chloroflexota bacterium]